MSGSNQQTTQSNQSQNSSFNQLSNMLENMATQGSSNFSNQSNVNQTGTQSQTGATTSNTTGTNFQNTTGTTAEQTANQFANQNAGTSAGQYANNQQQAGTSQGATSGQFSSQQNPWAPAVPSLYNLIGAINGQSTGLTPEQAAATGVMNSTAAGIPNMGPNATAAINNLYSSANGIPQAGMWGNAYQNYQNTIAPFLNPNNLNPWNTPGFAAALNGPGGLSDQITDRTKALYAASGRDPTGAGSFAGSLGRGIASAEAPIIASQYNANANNLLSSAENALQGGGQTAQGMTNLLQTPAMNEIAAMQASGNLPGLWMGPSQAMLGAANTAYGLPFANIAAAQNLLQPLAGLGGQTAGQNAGMQTGATTSAMTGGGTQSGQTTGTSSGVSSGLALGQNATNTSGGMTSDTTGTSSLLGQTSQQTAASQSGTTAEQRAAQGSSSGSSSGTSQGTSTGTSTTSQPVNPWTTAAGIGLGLFSLSDARTKENIEPVGLLNNGLNVYRFNYKGDPRPTIGVMAQEVEQVKPEAVAEVDGVKFVDYNKASQPIGMWAA